MVHVPVTRMQGIDNPYREISTDRQGGRGEGPEVGNAGVVRAGQEAQTQESRWVSLGRQEQHRKINEPEGTDAIEN